MNDEKTVYIAEVTSYGTIALVEATVTETEKLWKIGKTKYVARDITSGFYARQVRKDDNSICVSPDISKTLQWLIEKLKDRQVKMDIAYKHNSEDNQEKLDQITSLLEDLL